MAIENQNDATQEQAVAADIEKAAPVKRVRKPTVKKTDSKVVANQAGLYGIAPYQPTAKEEYMSQGQLEHFRKILEAWQSELMQEVDRTMSHMQDESAALPDINDRATQEEEFAIELRTRDRERKLIRKIEQSLKAIEEEDYGYCDTCGIEIGLRRLEARPTATQCIDCKTLAESKETQTHG
jgi:DnaK suppressor protein